VSDDRPASSARGEGLRIAIVVSRFNEPITESMALSARETLLEAGVDAANLELYRVPGAWELPLAVEWILRRGGVDGVVALGCVIRGETPHFEYVSTGATLGLEAAARTHAVPVGFGLLTTDDGDQARARAGGRKGNKGEEAARAVLAMCRLARTLR
jgi:6,7-dimethyl-8-ribityllumazine synthase